MPSHLAHFQWQQKGDASTNHKQESKCYLLIQMQQRHFLYMNKLLKSKILSSYLRKLCCFIHHILYSRYSNKKRLWTSKLQKLFTISDNLYHQICLASEITQRQFGIRDQSYIWIFDGNSLISFGTVFKNQINGNLTAQTNDEINSQKEVNLKVLLDHSCLLNALF